MLEANQTIQDRYQLQKLLGKRPARQTWLAIDLEDKQQVVIKFLAFGGQVQWEDLKLFEREAQVLRELNHQYIPQYRDYFSIDDRVLWFALVEEYIEGFSLQNLLESGTKFTESEVKNIARQLLKILIYLHQLNPQVLHRDIKPSNIILQNEKTIYLVDFGAVQDKAAAEGASFTVVGTYGYTPIEQFGGRANSQSDLYALGATLIHLLTHTPPADLPQKDLRLQFKNLVSISSCFYEWLYKMTEPAADNRFSSAREALKVLQSNKIVNSVIEEEETESYKYLQIRKTNKIFQAKIISNYPHFNLRFFLTLLFIVVLISPLCVILFIIVLIPCSIGFGMLLTGIISPTMLFLYRIIAVFTGAFILFLGFYISYLLSTKINFYISKIGCFSNTLNLSNKKYRIDYKILNITYAKYWFKVKNIKQIKLIKIDSKKTKIIIESKNKKDTVKLDTKLDGKRSQQFIDEVKDWLKI